MKCLWIAVICIYVNFIVFLFADYSLWYFFGTIACIGIFVCATSGGKSRSFKVFSEIPDSRTSLRKSPSNQDENKKSPATGD